MDEPLTNRFPPDVERRIAEICVNAILRAIENGTYVEPEETKKAASE